jgi:hypothetical protein
MDNRIVSIKDVLNKEVSAADALKCGYKYRVILRRGRSPIHGPQVDCMDYIIAGWPNTYAIKSITDAQALLDHDDIKQTNTPPPSTEERATEAMIQAELNAPAGLSDGEIDELGNAAYENEID